MEKDLKAQQEKLITARQEEVEADCTEHKRQFDEAAKTPTGIQREETFKDLTEYGMSAAEVLNFLDAIMRGSVRWVSIDWLGGEK